MLRTNEALSIVNSYRTRVEKKFFAVDQETLFTRIRKIEEAREIERLFKGNRPIVDDDHPWTKRQAQSQGRSPLQVANSIIQKEDSYLDFLDVYETTVQQVKDATTNVQLKTIVNNFISFVKGLA